MNEKRSTAMSTALGNRTQRNAQRTTSRKCDASGHLVFDRGDWVTHAQCRGKDPDALFVRGAEQLSLIHI